MTLNEVEVAKLNLGSSDTLIVTFKGSKEEMNGLNLLSDLLSETFNKNRVVVLGLGLNDEVKFHVVKEVVQSSCEAQSYCQDCNCGKKESIVTSAHKEFEQEEYNKLMPLPMDPSVLAEILDEEDG